MAINVDGLQSVNEPGSERVDGAKPETASTPPSSIPSSPALESLAPCYEPEQHETYLRHLQKAVESPKNLNIALTGRYGTGKSSVLDEFEAKNKSTTLRIAISTLGPDPDSVSLTNQLQKELVKQFLYRATPRQSRFSRFNRIVPLTWRRAVAEATAGVAAFGMILALLGWLPKLSGTPVDSNWLVRASSGFAFAVLVIAVLSVLRRSLHGRFVVSDVSAAGATVKLAREASTYFDEYLDEIVYFFDEVSSTRIVIFEDLDRFDDPHIFEALRELNTLLNNTAKRHKKMTRRYRKGKPLRFVYAIKDSLFERLGSDAIEPQRDAVAAETVRANRTKFFDIVIPVVPFLSHRNARELLSDLLRTRAVTGVDRTLVELVAQSATDMRLLRNICNEYVVFAERLLNSGKTAPGLTATNLFALVAYKNFHLKDFEEISRRSSKLDELYERYREVVTASIEACEEQKRDLLAEPARYRLMEEVAQRLGEQLVEIGKIAKAGTGNEPMPYMKFSVGGVQYASDTVCSYPFWAAVAEADAVDILASHSPNDSCHQVRRLDAQQVQVLFGEALGASRWAEADEDDRQLTLVALDEQIKFLRGASFQDLAVDNRFALSTEDGSWSFGSLVERILESKLAWELVKGGYLDRNFTLYAAQFYGDFTGVDVATFIVQAVQANKMDIYYDFSGAEDVANLLTEVAEDFSRTISAYNIAILDYFLRQKDRRAADIADTVASNFGDDAQRFLSAYSIHGSEREGFAALLSRRPWRNVLTYLTQEEDIPANVRLDLVDSALRNMQAGAGYELTDKVRSFIATNYREMKVFTHCQDEEVIARVVALAGRAGVIIPDLVGLDRVMRDRLVLAHLYALTAGNLREALGVTGNVSFDRVRKVPDVYDRCQQAPNEYLAAVENDSDTRYSVLTETVLVEVLADVAEEWEANHVQKLIEMAAPESRLKQLDEVPKACWPHLAAQHHFLPTARNVHTYREAVGSIDEHLAGLLVHAEGISVTDEAVAVQTSVAVAVLNASGVIGDARRRVELVDSLNLEEFILPSEVEPEEGALLALLLEHKVVQDSAESFDRFRTVGWAAIELAIAKSAGFVDFMKPELVRDYVSDLLGSCDVPPQALDKVIDSLAEYVPNDDKAALLAAGRCAIARMRPLPVDQVRRVAAVTGNVDVTLRLLAAASPVPPVPDVVEALAALGEPYSYLVNHAKDEFDVPGDEAHRKVFENLRDADRIVDFRKRPLKNIYHVKLA